GYAAGRKFIPGKDSAASTTTFATSLDIGSMPNRRELLFYRHVTQQNWSNSSWTTCIHHGRHGLVSVTAEIK
ncbi:hypothetical protein ACFROC_26645, partial [Nocardia tengchongensis]|uniref:hypothetical protein n=1 Tax=Nocardia tengchongensis TaxID=2055889 RepID=UPI00368FF8F5